MSDLEGRLARLEADNAQLLQRVEDLALQVATTRAGGFRSMRDTRRCPACGGGKLVHVPRMQEAAAGTLVDFALAHEWKWSGIVSKGPIECFACQTCGLVEMHVTDFKDTVDNQRIVAIDPERDPTKGPYR